jgi:hypothetical protein
MLLNQTEMAIYNFFCPECKSRILHVTAVKKPILICQRCKVEMCREITINERRIVKEPTCLEILK